ncbi:hypothetical protein [Enhydrobacter aerosaccus]|uniref:hypothetical protein n=1 Tax=Enhydrobacter aerosaccus TaxID=225324 RepID=UPI0011178EC8|nr:hypothetical protein [Enhydrobacter aerosaccus]
MAFYYDISHGHGFGSWLEHLRGLSGRTLRTIGSFQASGQLATKRAGDRHRDFRTHGDDAFWRDLVVSWLLALLLIAAILTIEAINGPHSSRAARFLTSQTAHSTNIALPSALSSDEVAECSDLDYAREWC